MSDHSDVERLGVTLAQLEFTAWRWAFREQPILDYGIDAHVEPKRDGVASGRPIALQIKTGQSYFAKPVDDGWTYRGKDKDRHLRYWLGHTLPVLIILCDERTKTLYWQHVTPDRVNYTANDWTIVIPRTQTISPHAMDTLWTIAQSATGAVDDPLELTMPLLPPSAVEALRGVAAREPRGTLRLAVALSRGRYEPQLAVQTILRGRPSWLERGGGHFEAALGTYAAEHGLHESATESLVRAAEQVETGRGRLYAMAAMFATNTGDPVQAAELIQRADAGSDAPLLVAAARLGLRWAEGDAHAPVPDALGSASAVELASEPTCLLVLGQVASRRQDVTAALRCAEAAFDAMPQSSAAQIRLAEMLLWRVSAGPPPCRQRISVAPKNWATPRCFNVGGGLDRAPRPSPCCCAGTCSQAHTRRCSVSRHPNLTGRRRNGRQPTATWPISEHRPPSLWASETRPSISLHASQAHRWRQGCGPWSRTRNYLVTNRSCCGAKL